MSSISFVWQVFSFQQLPETSWTIEGEPEFSFLDLVIPAGLSMSQQCLYPKLSDQVEIYEPMSLRFFDSLRQCYVWSTYCVPIAGLVTGHWRFKDEWAHLFQPKSLESMSNTDSPSPSPITVTGMTDAVTEMAKRWRQEFRVKWFLNGHEPNKRGVSGMQKKGILLAKEERYEKFWDL